MRISDVIATGPILPKKTMTKQGLWGLQGGSHVGPMNRAILGDKLNGRWVLDIDNQLYPLMTMVKTMMHIIHRQRKKGKYYSEPSLYQMDSERMWHNLVEYIFPCSVYLALDRSAYNVLTSYSLGNTRLSAFYLRTISDNPYKKGLFSS